MCFGPAGLSLQAARIHMSSSMFSNIANHTPSPADAASSTCFSTADLFDAFMDDVTANVRVCRPGLNAFGCLKRYCGPIATVSGIGDDVMRLRDVLEEAGEGRVLVADGQGCPDWALLGDKMASLAIARNWAGVILNGYVRDTVALRQLAIGVHALGTVPSRPKWPSQPRYARDHQLTFQNCTFTPGSWVYADEDGILVADRCLLSAADQPHPVS